MDKKLEIAAFNYAIKCHTETNHLYDGQPYKTHLTMVVLAMDEFAHLIPREDRGIVEAACWVHDVIEDCRQTYNDVKEVLGEQVAEIAYALTNEKGKNRKERANDKYYQGIMAVKYAPFVKLCDRIANVRYSRGNGGSMYEKYRNENNDFVSKIYKPEYNEMVSYLLKYCSEQVPLVNKESK